MRRKVSDYNRTILILLFAGICIWGVVTSIQMNMVNRSLWLDEAMLSYSFSKRSLLNLWNGPFEADQIAPLGWLYFEKILSLIFGNTEFVLRTGSVLAYTVTMAELFYLLRTCFGTSAVTASAAAAMYANLPFVLKYANVFKPYIADGAFILLVFIVFDLYQKEKINLWVLFLLWSALIWFSNPVCFFEGGCLLMMGICALKNGNRRQLREAFLLGIGIVFVFVIYYLFWLRSVAVSEYMQNFWQEDYFPLFPRSKGDLSKIKKAVNELYKGFDSARSLMLLLTGLSMFYAVVSRNIKMLSVIMGLLITLIASSIHFFPISDRLWVFFLPLMIAFCFYGIEKYTEYRAGHILLLMPAAVLLLSRLNMGSWDSIFLAALMLFIICCARKFSHFSQISHALIKTFILIFLVISVTGIKTYWNHPENVYWPTEELNNEITYLQCSCREILSLK